MDEFLIELGLMDPDNPRRETRRQREARERREAKQAAKLEKELRKLQEKERKETRKRRIKKSIESFNRTHNVSTKYISRVKSYFKRHGRELTTEEVEQVLLNEYLHLPIDAGEVTTNIKIGYDLYGELGVRLWYIEELEIPFIQDKLPEIFGYLDILFEKVPNGFVFGCALIGKFEGKEIDEDGNEVIVITEETIFRSYMTDDLERVKGEISESGRLNVPSVGVYLVTDIQIFFETEQGGSNKNINIDDLKKKYYIFNPDSVNNCGKKCLEYYNIESRKGFMSLTDIKGYNPPVPVYEDINEAKEEEFILLRDNHFIICISKNKRKMDKLNIMKTDKYKKDKMDKTKENIKKYNVLVFDIESYNESRDIIKNKNLTNKTYQVPILIGFCHKKEDKYIYNSFYGDDCVKQFIDMIRENDYTHIIGYNSGKYDYILIKNEILKQKGDIKEYRKNANAVMRGTITFANKSIEMVDLLNFTSGSLKSNLKSYKCEISKGEIDYNKIGRVNDDDFKKDLDEYCKKDVIGTYQLYEKLELPYTERGIIFLDLFTASQGSYKILKDFWRLANYDIQKMVKREKDNYFRDAIYGGRCEVFKREFKSNKYEDIRQGKIKYDDVDDYMRALDVNSLYPSAMRNNLYPVGKEKLTTKFIDGKLGIYNCKIEKPKDIEYPVVFDKDHKSYNLFDCEGTYTSIDILQMRKYGYKVKILSGYYWDESEYIFKDYVDEFYRIKKESAKGSPQYGNAKLMLNAVYGKTLQRDQNEINFTFTTKQEIEEAKRSLSGKKGKWKGEIDRTNGTLLMTFTEDESKNTNKKSYLGAFILSYSKIDMYDKITISNPYYTDTDSLYIDTKYSHLFKIGDELGEYSDDYKGKIIYASFMAKKLKYLEILQEDGTIKRSYTGKGCFVDTLTKKDFKDMIKEKEIVNVRPFKMVRNLKDGTVEYIKDDEKIIKMNDSNRVFEGNNSKPLGYLIN